MIHRSIELELVNRLAETPAIVLLGPRQVGKTTLAKRIATGHEASYLDLELPSDKRRLDDAESFLRSNAGKLIIIDEVHRAPELFTILRSIIDERRANGESANQFLLLGSAALDLLQQTSESLAGRVSYLELQPFDLLEVQGNSPSADMLWTRGGFPKSYLASSDEMSFRWRRDFIKSYLERDIPMFAPRLPAETIGRLWTMLANGQGSLLHSTRLATSLGMSAKATNTYIDLLVDMLLIRRLRPWAGNVGKRLTKSPKIYIRDSGLVHALLDQEDTYALLGHSIVGASWEGFVIENLIAVAGDRRIPFFYRTEDGAEVDLLFERGGKVEMMIEIKRTSAPTVSRGFMHAREVLKPAACYIIHGGTHTWPMRDGIIAISLFDLMQKLKGTNSK